MSEKFNQTILDYTKNRFNTNVNVPDEIPDEEFLEIFKDFIEQAKYDGICKVLNDRFPHGDNDIKFVNENDVSLEIYKSIAGNIPIFYARNNQDFAELVDKLVYKGKGEQQLESVGASFASGKSIRFIILSNKPYSNISAESIGLDDETWKKYSMIIRRDHECAHYFTKRFLGSTRNNIHDELIADFAGIISATKGVYYPDWFLKGMGIDQYPKSQPEGRLPVYVKEIETAKDLDTIKKITVKVANNVKIWSETNEAKAMSYKDKILFVCKNNLLDWYEMY